MTGRYTERNSTFDFAEWGDLDAVIKYQTSRDYIVTGHGPGGHNVVRLVQASTVAEAVLGLPAWADRWEVRALDGSVVSTARDRQPCPACDGGRDDIHCTCVGSDYRNGGRWS